MKFLIILFLFSSFAITSAAQENASTDSTYFSVKSKVPYYNNNFSRFQIKVHLSDEINGVHFAEYWVYNLKRKPVFRSASDKSGGISFTLMEKKKFGYISIVRHAYGSVKIPVKEFEGFDSEIDVFLKYSDKPLH